MRLYPKLAFSGIAKNARLYIPYMISGSMMAAMFYIMAYLLNSQVIMNTAYGARTISILLFLGLNVIGIFATLILFYTNSFLIRRRMKEFGLYNILGMGKWSISAILLWENIITAFVCTAGGLLIGISLSKLAELIFLRMMGRSVGYEFSVSSTAVLLTSAFCAAVFLLIFLFSAVRLRLSDPVALMKSEAGGEKPPKVNWLLGLLGFLLLAAAYYLAVTIDDPLKSMDMFFICVIMVIFATFMLFISGSVMLCRLLQKNKGYYYKTRHFISISQMAWRMKRNGAGLAAICILCTMVLVTISTTSCLYFGSDLSFKDRYNNDLSNFMAFSDFDQASEENYLYYRKAYEDAYEKFGIVPKRVSEFDFSVVMARIYGGEFILDGINIEFSDDFSWDYVGEYGYVYIISEEDYNRETGRNVSLSDGEALICLKGDSGYHGDTLILDEKEYRVAERTDDFGMIIQMRNFGDEYDAMYIVVPDFRECVEPMLRYTESFTYMNTNVFRYYGVDTDSDAEDQIFAYSQSQLNIERLYDDEQNGKRAENGHQVKYTWEMNAAYDKYEFLSNYGTLFFLGIFLSAIFLLAAVLIIYYKQISEGYEDQSRFGIMRKVGMTDKDIRGSVNSQVLTVFFAPLVTAVIHLCFAFPMLRQIMILFELNDLSRLLLTSSISVGVFALVYLAVYKLTSAGYYAIVSSDDE